MDVILFIGLWVLFIFVVFKYIKIKIKYSPYDQIKFTRNSRTTGKEPQRYDYEEDSHHCED